MAARLRAQTHANIDRLNVIEALYSTSHELTAAGNLQDVARIASRQAARLLGATVVVLIPEDGALCIRGSQPPGSTLGVLAVRSEGGVHSLAGQHRLLE